MTIVIAAKNEHGKPYIASDSRGSNGYTYTDYNHEPKIIRVKNFIVGYTYSYRTAIVIEHNKKKFKDIHTSEDVYHFCNILKKLLVKDGQKKEAELDEKKHPTDLAHTVGLLIITDTKIFEIHENYSFHEIKDCSAIGSGTHFAKGALFVLMKLKSRVFRIDLETAIEAAMANSVSCGGTIHTATI